jgi:hypothetical protein
MLEKQHISKGEMGGTAGSIEEEDVVVLKTSGSHVLFFCSLSLQQSYRSYSSNTANKWNLFDCSCSEKRERRRRKSPHSLVTFDTLQDDAAQDKMMVSIMQRHKRASVSS